MKFLNPYKKLIIITFLIIASTLFAQKQLPIKKGSITWIGSKIGSSHNGTINLKKGFFLLDKKRNVSGCHIEIDMSSIKNKDIKSKKYNKKLVNHLKNKDFFDVEKHPLATFHCSKVISEKKAKTSHVFSGTMTIRGVSQKADIPVMLSKKGKGYLLKANLKINRTDYGIKYNSKKFFKNLGDHLIKDKFEISLSLKS